MVVRMAPSKKVSPQSRTLAVVSVSVLCGMQLLDLSPHIAPDRPGNRHPSPPSFAAGVAHPQSDMKVAAIPRPFAGMWNWDEEHGEAHLITHKTQRSVGMAPDLMEQARFREFIQHVNRRLGRLEERWLGPVDFDRAGMRLSGMDTYAIIASVLLQVLIGLYGCIDTPDKDADTFEHRIFDAQMVLLMIATLCSAFTMVMFLLNKVYAVTALGFWKDVSYQTFVNATMKHRFQGFWSLIVSTVAFMLTFALNLIQKLPRRKGLAVSAVALAITFAMVSDWAHMMMTASKFIFDTYPAAPYASR
eukprot:TRINITY_DN81737_c0_g1_i1.p1 TRINITY_DN81737_c0_g1~~TRINITY_DN81737_c0_g1_i1.p1  ORF type:complete len:303 (-),score=73.92 TRINITY_DN81737_c0_g1_i1:185-1093(-)